MRKIGQRKKQTPTAALLLGLGLPGLDIARSLGRRGIPVFGHDRGPNWACLSRYVMPCPSAPDEPESALLEAVLNWGRQIGGHPLLIPLQDDYVLFVSRHREALERVYRFVLPDAEVIESLVSKSKMWSLCSANGVALPLTLRPHSSDDFAAIASEIRFPCLIKPNYSRSWVCSPPTIVEKGQKAIQVTSAGELVGLSPHFADGRGDVIVQEVIRGPDSNLHYVVAYFDNSGRSRASFVGRKLRTCPPHFGPGTYVESVHAPEIAELAVKLLSSLGYKGCAGVEVKLDPRDGVYKLIEVNARFGLWDGFAAKCGVDFAYLAYADAVGLPLPPEPPAYRAGMRWVQPERDFWAVLDYFRSGELSPADWLRSLFRCRAVAGVAWDDPLPWLGANAAFLRSIAAAARSKVLS